MTCVVIVRLVLCELLREARVGSLLATFTTGAVGAGNGIVVESASEWIEAGGWSVSFAAAAGALALVADQWSSWCCSGVWNVLEDA